MRIQLPLSLLIALGVVVQGHDGDFTNSFAQIAAENGYAYEEYKVTTSDGYINTVFRIPGKTGETSTGKPIVYFQHGILDSADAWVMNHASDCPALTAAAAGYDVWAGNTRGNRYSQQHTTLTTKDDAYWQYSFQEMGDYDLPANFEFIRSTTGIQKFSYVGHSQGTTSLFYGLATNEDLYAEYLNLFVATGPVLELTNAKSGLLTFVAENDALLVDFCNLFGIYDFFPYNFVDSTFMKMLCGYIPYLCDFGMSMLVDEDPSLDDTTRMEDYSGGHFPNGASLKSLLHYGQIITSKKFQKYDYGNDNMKIYGQSTPPIIDISKIKGEVPIAMFVGLGDELADTTDAEWARDQMGAAVVFYHEYNLGHMSFLVAKDMSFFTVDALTLIKKYNPLPSTTEIKFMQ